MVYSNAPYIDKAMTNPHFVFFEDQLANSKRLYENPIAIVTAFAPWDIKPALARLQTYQKDGFYLAGYFAYELGYLLEPKLHGLLPKNFKGPLLHFGVFESFTRNDLPVEDLGHIHALTPEWTRRQYLARFKKIMAYIKAGDVYQINLSFPVTGAYSGSANALYHQLKSRQPVRYGGVISLGGARHVTLSPELFFETKSDTILMRPMKGTIRRGDTPEQDIALAKNLQSDAKNRAENLMIVDLLRNDLARLSFAGSVKVTDLFALETFPTLHTMTSGIEARLKPDTKMHDILKALFPCGSITGAPKIRAQEIIRELEPHTRGSYCGALGLMDPDGNMRFNVGIRTLTLDADGQFTYPVGSGIVADSQGVDEYAECLLKAKFLHDDFTLLETIGYEHIIGFMHFELHMARLEKSALELGFIFDKPKAMQALAEYVQDFQGPQKVRLELSKNGPIEISHQPLTFTPFQELWPIAVSNNPVNSKNPLRLHKTNHRSFMDRELSRLAKKTGCKDVIFINEKDQVCEGSYTNIFIVKNGDMFTPPVSCGLLPGILRQVLLASGDVTEKILSVQDLYEADEIFIGNSARGLIKAQLVSRDR